MTPEQVNVVREMASKGLPDARIAAELGVHPRTVFRARHRHGIAPGWTPPPPVHGGSYSYNNGCRCDNCRKGHRERMATCQASRVARRDTADFQHGAGGYVNWGCRCPICTRANADLSQMRRDRRRERQAATS